MQKQENAAKVVAGAPQKRVTLSDQLRGMEVNYSITLPIERMKCAQTLACQIGLIMNRTYRTRSDRLTRTVTVTRVE